MSKRTFTLMIQSKGWQVKDALEYWGRSQNWYHLQFSQTDKEIIRLGCMIKGLEIKSTVEDRSQCRGDLNASPIFEGYQNAG